MFRTLAVVLAHIMGFVFANDGLSQEIIVAKQVGKQNNFEAETPYGKVLIEVTSPIIYLPEDKPDPLRRFLAIGLVKNGKSIPETGNFFATEPKPIKFGYANSSEYSVERFKTLNLLTFTKPGKTMFCVELGDFVIHVPLSVESVPFKKGMSSDELISTLGIPEATHKFWVKWPTDKHVDTIFYTVTAGQSIRAIEHWMFDKYPNCMFAIENDSVIGIHSVFVDEDNKSEFAERWKHPIKDAKEAEKTKAALEAFIEKKEAELGMRDNKEIKPKTELETYSLMNGKEIKASFFDYKSGTVILFDENNAKIELPMSDFDAPSAAKIREAFKKKPKATTKKK